MKALIIEDEILAAQSLQKLVKEVSPDTEIIGILQSIEESVAWFDENPMPDLVFMDIHLADGSSFAIFDKTQITVPSSSPPPTTNMRLKPLKSAALTIF